MAGTGPAMTEVWFVNWPRPFSLPKLQGPDRVDRLALELALARQLRERDHPLQAHRLADLGKAREGFGERAGHVDHVEHALRPDDESLRHPGHVEDRAQEHAVEGGG